MAQLKDSIVSGNLRVTDTTLTDTIQVTKIKALTTVSGSSYGPGTSGQVLKSNGTSGGVYWGDDASAVTGVKGNAETNYRTGNVNLTPANIGALALTGGTVSSSTFGTQITVERTGGANMASLGFKNTAGMLGYISASEVDGDLYHYGADTSKKYNILDSNNSPAYKAITQRTMYFGLADGSVAAGWKRVLTVPAVQSSGGMGINDIKLFVRRGYNSTRPESFSVHIVNNYTATPPIYISHATQDVRLMTQIRITKSSDGKKLHVEIYYNSTARNRLTIQYNVVYSASLDNDDTYNVTVYPTNESDIGNVSDSPTALTTITIPSTVASADLKYVSSYWGMTGPSGEDNIWIRTTSQGIIPYQTGNAGSGHGSIGTSTWYFANAYIDRVYGTTTKAIQDESGNNIKATYGASLYLNLDASPKELILRNKNDESLSTISIADINTDEKVKVTEDTTNKIYPIGIISAPDGGTRNCVADDNIYFEATTHALNINSIKATNISGDVTFTSFGSGTVNVSRSVFFKDSSANKIVVNSNFQYNPSTDVLKVGSITGSAAKWTTGRTITIGSTGKTVDGSGDVSWSLSEIGAAPAVSGGYLPLSGGTMTGSIFYVGDGGRKLEFGGNTFKYWVATTSNWAGGLNYYDADGVDLGAFGAYGTTNGLSYFYIGGTYNAPYFKITRTSGNIEMKSGATFTFGSFATASDNVARHVFFRGSSSNQIVVDDDFKYNPSTNVLTVGSISGSAASANKLNTDAGGFLDPVYFSNGIPVNDGGRSIPFVVAPATDTTAGTWTGTLTGLTAYYDGLVILYKPAVAGASTTTLNLNGLGAKTCYLNGTSKLTTHFPKNQPILLVYSSSQNSGCWEAVDNYDSGNSNTYDRNRYQANIKSGSSALVNGNIIVGKDGVFNHLKSGGTFDISYPILYNAADVAANTTTNNTYDIIHFTVTTTQSISLTAYKPVFIKGTLSGTIFTPISTTPLTQTVPTSDDSYMYMYLGNATAATTVYLQERHPIYAYKNGVFGEIVNYATAAPHPSGFTEKTTAGFYKYTVNTNGHVSAGDALAKSDITALGIPAQDTKYSAGDHLALSSTTFSLASYCKTITDWNSATTNGWYMGSSVTNAPSTAWWFGRVIAHNNKYCLQEAWAFASGSDTDARHLQHKLRWFKNNTWGSWVDASIYHVGDNSRTVMSFGNGLVFTSPTANAWAQGLYYNSTSGTQMGFIGAYGATPNALTHFDLGSAWNSPWVRVEKGTTTIYDNGSTGPILALSNMVNGDAYIKHINTGSGSTTKTRNIIKCGVNASDDTGVGLFVGHSTAGLTVLGSGESIQQIENVMFSETYTPYTKTVEGATVADVWTHATEKLVNISDFDIYFITGANDMSTSACTDWTDMFTTILDRNGYFKPSVTDKGSIGTSGLQWHSVYATTLYEGSTSLTNKYVKKAGDSMSGDLSLHSTSGDSPALIFQRGTTTDDTLDWKIFNTGGKLKFDRSKVDGTWENILDLDPTNSVMRFKGTAVSLNGHTHSYLPLSGGTITKSSFGPLTIERTGGTQAAAIYFKNTNGVLGAIGMTSSVDSGLYRWTANTSSSYRILDAENYTSYTYGATTSRTANTVLAAPNGSNGAATFRALVADDLPSHSHSDYVLKAGDTMSGGLTISQSTGGTFLTTTRSDTSVTVKFGVGSDGTSHGIYSSKQSSWLFYGDASNVYIKTTAISSSTPSTEAWNIPLLGSSSNSVKQLITSTAFRYKDEVLAASAGTGHAIFIIGNGSNTGASGNRQGSVRLYSESTSYIDLVPASTSSAKTITLPASSGTIATREYVDDLIGDINSILTALL